MYLGDQQNGLEWVDAVGVRRCAFAQFDGRDAGAPDVRTAVIGRLADHLVVQQYIHRKGVLLVKCAHKWLFASRKYRGGHSML